MKAGNDMMSEERQFQILQNWFSPAFPIGAFSYSHGLESAIYHGVVTDKVSLQSWIDCLMRQGASRNDIIFITAAYRGEDVNQLCLALSAGRERFQETTELGRAFTQIMRTSCELAMPDGLAYPVAVGGAAQQMGLDVSKTALAYLQGFCTNLISVAVRSIPIGQGDGQQCLMALLPVIEEVCADFMHLTIDDVGGFALAADIYSLQHETAEQRIYRT